MISKKVESINELVDKLRLDEIEGTIEIIINNKGKINRIMIRRQQDKNKRNIEEEIRKAKKRIEIREPDLSHADFSNIDLTGSNFSGTDLHEADFSYSNIERSNLSGANLEGANFYKARLSETDLSNAYGVNVKDSYLTGSVNLYNANEPATAITNPYEGASHEAHEYDEDEFAEHPMDMSKIAPYPRKGSY